MAVLTAAAFISKYATIFADNSVRAISEEDLRDFRQDLADSFLNKTDGGTVVGNVSIGSGASANAPLQFAAGAANRKIVLDEVANNDHQVTALGVTADGARYQVPATTDDHIFYAGTSTTTSNELARVTGTGQLITQASVGVGGVTPAARLDVLGNAVGDPVLKYATLAVNDDPSVVIYQNKVTTTDATVTTLHTLAIPASTAVWLNAYIVARRTGGSAGTAEDCAGYFHRALYKNVAGTATLVSTSWEVLKESQGGWDCNLTTSGGNVLIEVTGAVDNNISWHLAELKVMQVGS